MNSMWLDIEEYHNGQYQIGFLVIDNQQKEIRGYETLVSSKDSINEILDKYNISRIFVFNENDSSYLKKLNYVNNCEIINVFKIYQQLSEGTNLQISKNSDIAKASGISINYDRLHSPLYDIQLSYCTFHNYKISSIDQQKDMLYDSFFVLTGKLDIYWSLIKTWNIDRSIIDLKMIITNNCEYRYFLDCSRINENVVSFLEYDTLEPITFNLSVEEYEQIISFFKNNTVLFLNAKDQKELSKRLWNLLYYAKIRINNKIPLFIFFGINLSRFKNHIDGYSIESIKNHLDSELSISNLNRINKEK